MLRSNQRIGAATDPHADGRQAPAGPVHHVEEEETRHGDEVRFWREIRAKRLSKWRHDLKGQAINRLYRFLAFIFLEVCLWSPVC